VSLYKKTSCCSRGYSFSRGINCLEDAPPSENVVPKTRFSIPSKATAVTNSIDIHIYLWNPLYHQITSCFNITMTPILARTVIESNRNRSRNQGKNPNHYERITTCRSCSYWNAHDPHYHWRLTGYKYTGRWARKRVKNIPRTKEKREENRFTTRNLYSQDLPFNTENRPPHIITLSYSVSEY